MVRVGGLRLWRTVGPLALAMMVPLMGVAQGAPQVPDAPPVSPPVAAQDPAASAPALRDSVTHDGPFTVSGQSVTILYHYKVLSARDSATGKSVSALASLQILDSHGATIFQETFPYTVSQRRFLENLSAAASLITGNGGVALVIRFLDQPMGAPEEASEHNRESWQLFGAVNGHLTSLGGVLPLGNGKDITVGGVVTAVMMRGGVAVMPMASTAEVLGFRAWTGSFYASVPMRFDWVHGQWGEGQQCYQTANGTLTERGCIMPLASPPHPQRDPNADTRFVRLFVAPDGNTDNLQNLGVSPETRVEFLELQAIAQWEMRERRVVCRFRNVWLRVRIDGKEGWVHGQDDFDALGLPVTSPQ